MAMTITDVELICADDELEGGVFDDCFMQAAGAAADNTMPLTHSMQPVTVGFTHTRQLESQPAAKG